MSFNRARYLQESFDASFFQLGLTPPEQNAFLSRVSSLLDEGTRLPKNFFDLSTNINLYARKESLAKTDARQKVLTEPDKLFDLHNVPYKKKDPDKKKEFIKAEAAPTRVELVMPPPHVIAQAAWEIKQKLGHYPYQERGKKGLPDNSPGWGSIRQWLFKNDLSYPKLVKRELTANPEFRKTPIIEQTAAFEKPAIVKESAQEPNPAKIALVFKQTAITKRAGLDFNYTKWDILYSARQTLMETGMRPTPHDGLIQYGPLADGKTTWKIVDLALGADLPSLTRATKSNASMRDETSLEKFLNARKIIDPVIEVIEQPRPERIIEKSQVSEQDIIDSARVTVFRTGRRPTSADGLIKYGPLHGIYTWFAADRCLANKSRGIVSSYDTLAQLLDGEKIYSTEAQKAVHIRPEEKIFLNDIEKSARVMLLATGKRPSGKDGLIQFGPLRQKTLWSTINSMFKSSSRLLESNDCKTLANFLDSKNIPLNNAEKKQSSKRPPVLETFSITDIEESVTATLHATGRRPAVTRDLIAHGPLKGLSTWGAIDEAIKNEYRGLIKTGYTNLNHLMDEKKIPVYLNSKPKRPKSILDIDDLEKSLRATVEATGRRPSKNDGQIEYGPLKDKENWKLIDKAFRNGNRGLDSINMGSLSEYMDTLGIVKNPSHARKSKENIEKSLSAKNIEQTAQSKNNAPVSFEDIFQECANYVRVNETKNMPPPAPALAAMDKALREGNVAGLERFSMKAVTTIVDFMLATGLLENRGNALTPAPLPKINFLVKTFA